MVLKQSVELGSMDLIFTYKENHFIVRYGENKSGMHCHRRY